jgi:soluble lytic murein transglycosylase
VLAVATHLSTARAARRLLAGGLGILVSVASAWAQPVPLTRPDHIGSNPHATANRYAPPARKPWLPKLLSDADAARYQRIFALQDNGEWQQADRLIEKLRSKVLLGHVHFQRYLHPTAYKSKYGELSAWLQSYADHPAAYRVYSLAQKRRPSGAKYLRVPVFGQEHIRHYFGEKPSRSQVASAKHRQIAQSIRAKIARSQLTVASLMIDRSSLPAAIADRLRAQTALGWLAMSRSQTAFDLASRAAARSRTRTAMPDWVAGLAAYRLRDYSNAAKHFGLHAKSKEAGDWTAPAGAYWAARAETKQGHHQIAQQWLRLAAKHPYTFYGQLALAQLGQPTPYRPVASSVSNADIAHIRRLPGGDRVLALLQIGQIRLADEELLQQLHKVSVASLRRIVAFAEAAKLPQTAMRGAFRLSGNSDEFLPGAMYPMPEWRPHDGFKLDQALIWAFVRQESVFNPRATSGAGARGLMQLMPTTANYIAGDDRFVGKRRDALYNPSLNLSLGQNYLRYLMDKKMIGQDLFRLTVAYNAGVGNLAAWQRDGLLADDPLLFIEMLPLLETRLFVERVIANYWIYRALMGQRRPSIKALLRDEWPKYSEQDRPLIELAEDFSRVSR